MHAVRFPSSAAPALVTVPIATADLRQHTAWLAAFNGPLFPSPLPMVFRVGTFTALPAGTAILEATISGSFGNASVPDSAPATVFLGDVPVASGPVPGGVASPVEKTPARWRHVFSSAEIAALFASGTLELTVRQERDGAVRLGPTTLVLRCLPVAEP